MTRRALFVAATVIALLAVWPLSAFANTHVRIVVISIGGTNLDDWTRADTPTLKRLMTEGRTGLVSARTADAPAETQDECLDHAGPVSLREGVLASNKDPAPVRAAVARAAGRQRIVYREVSPLTDDASFPRQRRFDYVAAARTIAGALPPGVTLIEIPDAHIADCVVTPTARGGWVSLSLRRADSFISRINSLMSPSDTLLIVSPTPPRAQQHERNFLTAAIAVGPDFRGGGLLTSAATRRGGVVSLTDVPTTVLGAIGADVQVGTGRTWKPAGGSVDDLRASARTYAHAARIRSPLLRATVWAGAFLIVASAALILSGRSRAGRRRIPRTLRDWFALSLTALTAVPAALLAEPVFGFTSLTAAALFTAAGAIALAFMATILGGPRQAIALVAGITMVLVAGDLAAGGPLASRSAISYSIAEGARFYGIGNELMGVLIVSALLWTATVLDAPRRPPAAVTAVLGVCVTLMAAPAIGAKFGAAFVAVPAFGAIVARAFGGPLDRRMFIGIAAATCFVAGVSVATDMLSSPDAQSHIGSITSADGGAGGVLGRKISAAARLLLGSYWTGGIVVSLASVGAFLWRRPGLVARAMWGRPHLRVALAGAVAASVAAVAFNDAGVVAAGLMIPMAAATFLHVILVEHAPREKSVAVERLKAFAR